MSPAIPQLLANCARLDSGPENEARLAHLAGNVRDWAGLPAQAEAHGLVPLLYSHLQTAGVSLPLPVKRELQALYLRHHHANTVRVAALADILAAFQSAGIEARVLKGAALAHLVYPQPGLRPMRDLDILVKPSEARRAQQILAGLGFVAPLPLHLPDKHLPAAARPSEGLSVSVELHHNLFNAARPASLTLEQLAGPPLTFCLSGLTVSTLGCAEMLWHLCEHVAYHANIWEPLRLVWVADIVGFAEQFAAQIDWALVRWRYPLVLSTLSLFHFITPLSATLRAQAALNLSVPPAGVGQEFAGWPRVSIPQQRAAGKSYRRILADTFYPPEWWLRLHYRLNAVQPVFRQRWLLHPWRVLTWAEQYLHQQAVKS